METIAQKIDKVINSKSGIKDSIEDYGIEVGDAPLNEYPQKIGTIGEIYSVPVVDASIIPESMDADTVYRYGTLAGDTTFPPFNIPSDPNVVHIYCWTFSTPDTAPVITWPNGITSWVGGNTPTIKASKTYEVSVMDGLAIIAEF